MSIMPLSADAYKAIYQDIPSDWRRQPGRPWQSWLATIHRYLRKLDICLDDVPELAADRVLWRGLIHGATHHLVHATDDDDASHAPFYWPFSTWIWVSLTQPAV